MSICRAFLVCRGSIGSCHKNSGEGNSQSKNYIFSLELVVLEYSLHSGTQSTQPARHLSTCADPGKPSLLTPDRQNLPDMGRRPADVRLQSRADPHPHRSSDPPYAAPVSFPFKYHTVPEGSLATVTYSVVHGLERGDVGPDLGTSPRCLCVSHT
jgi:hypothetical protein